MSASPSARPGRVDARTVAPLIEQQCDRLRRYIAEHLDHVIRIDDLAAVCILSNGYFHRAFKMTFGMTPHAYILAARIRQAKWLLENSSGALRDVAAACGFFDQAHLSNAFRNAYGMPPSQWRDAHGAADAPGLLDVPFSPDFSEVTLPPVACACVPAQGTG